jgi:hypothetical protein
VAKKSKSKFDPEAFLAKADGGVTLSKYGKGQVVFAQGEPADSVFYIREGRVKIAVVSEQGKEAVVAFLKAGDFIGSNSRRPMVTVIRPSRARCVKATIPRHERAVLTARHLARAGRHAGHSGSARFTLPWSRETMCGRAVFSEGCWWDSGGLRPWSERADDKRRPIRAESAHWHSQKKAPLSAGLE